MENPNLFAIQLKDEFVIEGDVAELGARVASEGFVVVARDVIDLGALGAEL